jgi:hypothetical protein
MEKPGRDIDVVNAPTSWEGAPGRHVVMVIGIDAYRCWRKLGNAVNDALETAALFGRAGFVQLRPPLCDADATGHAMQALIDELDRALRPDDSLVLFYAGHGATRSRKVGKRMVSIAHLVPVDGGDDDAATSWVELEPWLRRISLLPPRHILVILDACFSGAALSTIRWGRGSGKLPGLAYEAANGQHSRLLLASTLEAQRAMDDGPLPGHSLFTGCLFEALHGGAKQVGEHAGRSFTIGSELAHYVRHRVQTYPGRPGWDQTPDFGTFDHDDRGEMYIPLLVDPPAIVARGSTPAIATARHVTLRWVGIALVALVGGLVITAKWRAAGDRIAAPFVPPPDAAPGASARTDAAIDAPIDGTTTAAPPGCPMVVEQPRGATMTWDGGTAVVPATISLPCGAEVKVQFSRPDYLTQDKVIVGRVNAKPISFRLRRAPAAPANPQPRASDGMPAEPMPLARRALGNGSAGAVEPAVGTGRLVLQLDGPCQVAIDGAPLDGSGGRIDVALPAGRHRVFLEGADATLRMLEVDIIPDVTATTSESCPTRHTR